MEENKKPYLSIEERKAQKKAEMKRLRQEEKEEKKRQRLLEKEQKHQKSKMPEEIAEGENDASQMAEKPNCKPKKTVSKSARRKRNLVFLLVLITLFCLSFTSTAYILMNANKLSFKNGSDELEQRIADLEAELSEKNKEIEELTVQLTASSSSPSFSAPVSKQNTDTKKTETKKSDAKSSSQKNTTNNKTTKNNSANKQTTTPKQEQKSQNSTNTNQTPNQTAPKQENETTTPKENTAPKTENKAQNSAVNELESVLGE